MSGAPVGGAPATLPAGPPTDYVGASADAIQHHYDLSNDFFALWLDPQRIYSCAMWEQEDESLLAAQLRKLDYHVTSARAAGAGRVLDVGCGWGALLRRLVDVHGAHHVTGLTLSEAQAEYVSGRAGDQLSVRVENWVDHEPEQGYDAIISIGAFEHFAGFGLTRADRVAAYRSFFARCREWLPPGGRLSLQTIVKGGNVRLDRRMTRDLLFIVDRIFPESELPWPSEMLEASERLFDVVAYRNDADDYARTCAEWLRTLEQNADRAQALVGPDTFAEYRRYLDASAEAFRRRHIGLSRVVLECT